jgi:DNA-binding response OmpR family regulator
MQSNKAIKIFIVEDNADIREIYRLRLETAGFQVVTSENGLDFLTRIQDEKPNLILLDLMMPEMDGYSVLKSMRENLENPELKNIPVVIWSNLGEDEDVMKALNLGATYYLRKSDYQGDDLISKVKEILNEKVK